MPFVVALVVGLALTPLLGRLGLRFGLVDRPGDDGLKIHAAPVPLSGGIGVVLAAAAGAAAARELIPVWPATAITLMLALGVADDALRLPPLLRLTGQVGAGILVAVGGATFEPFGTAGPIAVVIAVPILTNAVNLIDGQDGLAGGLAVLAALGIWVVAAWGGPADAFGPALVGGLLAFLVWNRPPARVFLGNGGAYAVGCALVVLAAGSTRSIESLLGVGLCLEVFGVEVVSTVLRRASGRTPLLSGDRAHLYDLLAKRLAGRERATGWMLASGAVAAAAGALVAGAPVAVGLGVTVTAVAAGAVTVTALWRGSRAQVRRSW